MSAIPVAIYVRVSTSGQEYERQISDLKTVAVSHGWSIVNTFREKVSGVAESDARTALVNMLAEAKKGKFRKLIISEVSRLGRNTLDALNVVHQLMKMGVSVFSMDTNQETLRPDGELDSLGMFLYTIRADIGRMERATLKDRIKSGLANAKRNGVRLGRPPVEAPISGKEYMKKYPKVVRLLEKGRSIREIVKTEGVSKETVSRVRRAMNGIPEKPQKRKNTQNDI